MSLETDVMHGYAPVKEKLEAFGFVFEDNAYVYGREIMDGDFHILLRALPENRWEGHVSDTFSNEEYVLIRRPVMGAYTAGVCAAYLDVLEEVREACCKKVMFDSPAAMRLMTHAHETLDVAIEPWEAHDAGRFRAPNGKWFGLIMSIPYDKIDDTKTGLVDILNVKINPEERDALLKRDGFYMCYHMNKTHWITLTLDGRVSDLDIMTMLVGSYDLVMEGRTFANDLPWVIPSNPRMFDVREAFEYEDTIIWWQKAGYQVGDIVYIYLGAPFSCILFKTHVSALDVEINYEGRTTKVMKITRDVTFPIGVMSLKKMKAFGVGAVRGPRHITAELRDRLLELEKKL